MNSSVFFIWFSEFFISSISMRCFPDTPFSRWTLPPRGRPDGWCFLLICWASTSIHLLVCILFHGTRHSLPINLTSSPHILPPPPSWMKFSHWEVMVFWRSYAGLIWCLCFCIAIWVDPPVISEGFLRQLALEGSIPSTTQRREHRVRVKMATVPLLLREQRGPSCVQLLSISDSPLLGFPSTAL